jgi:OmpA-OmpF porin, OOP family
MPALRTLLTAFVIAGAALLPHAVLGQTAATPLYSGPVKQHWWGRTALGLSLNRTDFRVPCATVGGSCEELSFVGRASVGDTNVNLFGKVGSTSSARTYALGADSGFGLSYGAGVSWDFSPRASATVTWDAYDLRGISGPVRSTSLGLQLRY